MKLKTDSDTVMYVCAAAGLRQRSPRTSAGQTYELGQLRYDFDYTKGERSVDVPGMHINFSACTAIRPQGLAWRSMASKDAH